MRPLIKLFAWALFLSALPLAINAESVSPQRVLWIETFDHEDIPNSIGTWEHNVLDSNQGIKIELVDQDAAGKKGGKSLALHFDVDSPNPAMVGCWIKLENQDLSAFDALHFSLKSRDGGYFRGSVAVQFTDSGYRKAAYLISQIKDEWKEYRIPLKKFPRISDWSGIQDFEIIIDDINAIPKEGTLLVDEIYLSSSIKAEAGPYR
ncbi:MAG: hypothetical protein A2Z83_09075 [Omnitrophica bacterium GWA2_52_8]|nr:MAG: hypothetical protein A2Z83_09075 [Omnitrophica bacterium GWA2_52_8]